MYRHRYRNQNRMFALGVFVGLLCVMTVGYAAFQTNLNIAVKGNVKDKEHIIIGGIKVYTTKENDGLYKDAHEEGKYIYKGVNPDNYITFNNELWRIISVENNGTIKIKKNEGIGSMPFDESNNRPAATNTYCQNSRTYGCNAWAATSNLIGSPTEFITYYPYGSPANKKTTHQGTVTKDSTLNIYLNGEYYNSISDESKQYIVEGIFNVGSPGYTSYSEGFISDDIDTLKTNKEQEASYKWKGKIGLVTVTEYMNASLSPNCTTLFSATAQNDQCTDNWLRHSGTLPMFTITPSATNETTCLAILSYKGFIANNVASATHLIIPVLHLQSDITLSGSGTEAEPYIIN